MVWSSLRSRDCLIRISIAMGVYIVMGMLKFAADLDDLEVGCPGVKRRMSFSRRLCFSRQPQSVVASLREFARGATIVSGTDGNDYGCHFDRPQGLHNTGTVVVSVWISNTGTSCGDHHADTFWTLKATRSCHVSGWLGTIDPHRGLRICRRKQKGDYENQLLEIERMGYLRNRSDFLCLGIASYYPTGYTSTKCGPIATVSSSFAFTMPCRAKCMGWNHGFAIRLSQLLAKHDLKAVGYWVPEEGSGLGQHLHLPSWPHPSREEAKKNWDAMRADPAFQEMRERNLNRLRGWWKKWTSVYMNPTDFSPMK